MKTIAKRFGDFFIKLVSVKGALAITSWVIFAVKPDSEWNFWLVVIFNGLFVIGREWNKYLELLKIIRK
jgi:hypothetical protein